MTRRVVVADGQLYTFSPDEDVPLADRTWSLVSARLVDEITNEPPGGDVTIQAAENGFISRVASDGLVGLIGIPGHVFPKLAMQSYTINLTVTAQGYVARQVPVIIGPQVNFPNAFTPIIGTLFLHRLPVIIRGRTVHTNGITTTPLSGVTVSVMGIWRTFPPAHLAVPPDPPNLVSLQPPLYFPRRVATGQFRRRDVVQVMGQDKQLLSWVSSGSTFLNLSDRVNIAVGDILLIDLLNPDVMEYLTIGSIAGASTADQPARITLTYPLAYAHRSNAVVRKVTLQAPAVNNQFGQDAIVDDSCVFLASMNNLNLAQTVEITDGVNPPEYHNLSRFSVTSDATGYFQLPPLSRVAQLNIQANNGGVYPFQVVSPNCGVRQYQVASPDYSVSPDYSLRENHIDFTFK